MRSSAIYRRLALGYTTIMASTLYLDPGTWDLALDAHANIALATEPYSQLQDVASACRLFFAELWYDESQGVRYFEQVLGKYQPTQLLKSQLIERAMTVPGVTSAVVYLTDIRDRRLSGQVQVTLADGSVQVVTL